MSSGQTLNVAPISQTKAPVPIQPFAQKCSSFVSKNSKTIILIGIVLVVVYFYIKRKKSIAVGTGFNVSRPQAQPQAQPQPQLQPQRQASVAPRNTAADVTDPNFTPLS